MGLLYTFGIALFAAIGTFLFGFDTGIATTSKFTLASSATLRTVAYQCRQTAIAHQSWIDYMGHPSKGLTGAVRNDSLPDTFASNSDWYLQVVAVYIAGEALGALTQTAIGDRLGRLRFMQFLCIVVTIGTAIQTASVNIGMFLAGRVLAGYAVGWVLSSLSPATMEACCWCRIKGSGGNGSHLSFWNLFAWA